MFLVSVIAVVIYIIFMARFLLYKGTDRGMEGISKDRFDDFHDIILSSKLRKKF